MDKFRIYKTSDEIISAFLMQHPAPGKTANGSLQYYRGNLFSYGEHFKLASWRTDATGNRMVFLCAKEEPYTQTTKQQRSKLLSAIIRNAIPYHTVTLN